MTYDLFIGDFAYSSWSLRGWLAFRHLGLKPNLHHIDFGKGTIGEQMSVASPARTVPTMRTPDGTVVWDSLAIAEELHARYPEGGLWPSDPEARALGRALVAEMHAGFASLRNECPMNLRDAYVNVPLSDETQADITRIEAIWAHARAIHQDKGPWLLGTYSLADIAFAPVAARFAGYDVSLSDLSQAYVDLHLSDTMFRQWRTMALVSGNVLPWYVNSFDTKDWPGPAPLPAHAVDVGPSVNETCPFTGGAPRFFLEFDGKVFGFENKLCRDETEKDPEAWPAFMAITG